MKCSFAVSAGSGSKTEILSTWIRGNSEKSMSVGSAVRFVCGAAAFRHFLGANCRKPASASGARSRKATSKMKAAVVGTLGVDIGVFPGQRGRAACVHNKQIPDDGGDCTDRKFFTTSVLSRPWRHAIDALANKFQDVPLVVSRTPLCHRLLETSSSSRRHRRRTLDKTSCCISFRRHCIANMRAELAVQPRSFSSFSRLQCRCQVCKIPSSYSWRKNDKKPKDVAVADEIRIDDGINRRRRRPIGRVGTLKASKVKVTFVGRSWVKNSRKLRWFGNFRPVRRLENSTIRKSKARRRLSVSEVLVGSLKCDTEVLQLTFGINNCGLWLNRIDFWHTWGERKVKVVGKAFAVWKKTRLCDTMVRCRWSCSYLDPSTHSVNGGEVSRSSIDFEISVGAGGLD